MQAIMLRRFGPADELVPAEVPDPTAGPGQAIVQVEFASITFVETQIRAGRPPNPAMLPALPAVLGNGIGGIVTAVGPGADPDLIGATVVSTTGGRGGYAEQVAVNAADVIPVPRKLELAAAVALLADGRKALMLVRTAQPRPGETVLIMAAAGGVGSLLVQLARNAGATVVAVASSPRKLELVRSLGASLVVDYSQPVWADTVREQVSGVDLVLDGVGGDSGRAAFDLIRPGGRIDSYGMASGRFTDVADAESKEVTVLRGAPPSPEELVAQSRAALLEAAAGRLKPVIGQTFPLAEAARAHAAIESRATLGKTLLRVERTSTL